MIILYFISGNLTTTHSKASNLPKFLQQTLKKITDVNLLDKDLIKNLKNFKINEKKPLYQNIKQKLLNQSTKEGHKKTFSTDIDIAINKKFPTNGALTSKDNLDSKENVLVGAFSEEKRVNPKFHTKKLSELMKSYEVDYGNFKKPSIDRKKRFFISFA